jgi:murein DD-endopeptidase MepM/ murein hydrolase activator NlpD
VRTPAPAASPTPPPAGFDYTVGEGDTVSGLAERFHVTIDQIVAANALQDPASIIVGQVLHITGSDFVPTPPPTPAPSPQNLAGAGFIYPIAGACLPSTDYQMPNAPREYRRGVHEGVDFYTGFACVPVPAGTPALAAKAGRVIRADHDYVGLTQAELADLLTRSQSQGYTDAEALNRFRGRQVWIDHGGGVVTRYCHLSAIPDDIQVGQAVEQGHVVGYVGDSGTPESVTAPGVEAHLHFELRVGSSYLGAGLPPDQVRALYEQVFSNP